MLIATRERIPDWWYELRREVETESTEGVQIPEQYAGTMPEDGAEPMKPGEAAASLPKDGEVTE